MVDTIISALLPIVLTLVLGYLAGWHHDFDTNQASVLNRMVMLYTLPLTLFAGMASITRSELSSDVPLAAAVAFGMLGAFALTFAAARYGARRDLGTSALFALAVAGPAIPFMGVSFLGDLFPHTSALLIAVGGLVMNLVEVPVCIVLLSIDAADRGPRSGATTSGPPVSLGAHLAAALREPVVWAPLVALALVLSGVHLSDSIDRSLALLGTATGGVALFAAGVVLFAQRAIPNLEVGILVVARLLVVPLALWALLSLVGMQAATAHEAVLSLALPTAAITVILAVQYQKAEREMSSALLVGTLASVVTLAGFIAATGVR